MKNNKNIIAERKEAFQAMLDRFFSVNTEGPEFEKVSKLKDLFIDDEKFYESSGRFMWISNSGVFMTPEAAIITDSERVLEILEGAWSKKIFKAVDDALLRADEIGTGTVVNVRGFLKYRIENTLEGFCLTDGEGLDYCYDKQMVALKFYNEVKNG